MRKRRRDEATEERSTKKKPSAISQETKKKTPLDPPLARGERSVVSDDGASGTDATMLRRDQPSGVGPSASVPVARVRLRWFAQVETCGSGVPAPLQSRLGLGGSFPSAAS